MDADTFLEGGFEHMGSSDSDSEPASFEEECVTEGKNNRQQAGVKRKRGAVSSHKSELEKLKESDPEFFKYLQTTDQSLLEFGHGESDEEEEEDDEEDEEEEEDEDEDNEEDNEEEEELDELEEISAHEAGEDDDEEEEGDIRADDDEDEKEEEEPRPPSKRKRSSVRETVELTSHMVEGWTRALSGGAVHKASLKMIVGAFRSAVRFGDEDKGGASDGVNFVFSSSSVFNQLMQFCIGQMDAVLRAHVEGVDAPRKAGKSGVTGARAPQRTKGGVMRVDTLPHWRAHQLIIKSYLIHLLRFIEHLAESMERQAEMLHVALGQLHRLVPFLLPFPRLCPKALRALVRVWAAPEAGGQQCTLLAYASIRQLAIEAPAPMLDSCFKALYLAYARASKAMSRARLPRVVLMSSCVVDLCAVDPAVAYQHAFVYVRQLAIHLRNAIQKTSEEAYRQVYSWQFVNCIRLWAQVLCAHARPADSPLRQLVYPLVQITLGTARLLPNIRYAPLRFQCVRMLNQISAELGVFVPVAPLLLDAFRFAQLSKPPKNEARERLPDWAVMIKVSKVDAEKRRYQDGMLSQAAFLLAEHLHVHAYDISFPETVVPTVAALKRLAKSTKISSLQQRARRLVAQCDAQSAWLLRKREAVDFSPKDGAKTAAFLAEAKAARTAPFSKWFSAEAEAAEAREAELRDQADSRGPIQADRLDDSDEDDDDDSDGETGGGKAAKRKQRAQSKRERLRQEAQRQAALEADAAEGAAELSTARDKVEDFNLSDLDED
eukprot:scaffold189025_cov32-Tisochrysis_lutea.AAC.1